MKIAIINSFYLPDEIGGAEKSVRYIAEALASKGHQVCVICLSKSPRAEELNNVHVTRLPIRNIYLPTVDITNRVGLMKALWHGVDSYNVFSRHDLHFALKELKPDLIFTNNLSGFSVSAWSAARSFNLPIVHTIRDFYLLCPKGTMLADKQACVAPCYKCQVFSYTKRRCTKLVSHVVGISKFILDQHVKYNYFPGISASVIPNPYDAPESPYRSPQDNLVMGYIGRLAPEKGLEILLGAFRNAISHTAQLKLIVAGEGNEEYVDLLRQLAQGLPVEFVGRVQPERFFPEIDVTIVPSLWEEPLGRVVIESMAFGKPVIATPMGGIPELIGEDQGFLTVDASLESLSSVFQHKLASLRNHHKEMSTSALERAQAFKSASIAKIYEKVFQDTIDAHGQ
jgi:glycosyltransferase involved in cell wall biosynthesis